MYIIVSNYKVSNNKTTATPHSITMCFMIWLTRAASANYTAKPVLSNHPME